MSDEIIVTEGAEFTQTQAEETGEKASLHPAELRKAQKAIKDREKQVAELTAKLKEIEQGQMSEVDKLRARLQELDPIAKEAEELRTFAAARRDAALAALPKEAREKLAEVIEGLPPTKALALIESVSAVRGDEARAADVPRGSPARPTKNPTLDSIATNPDALEGMSTEQLGQLLGQAGVRANTGKVWGK